MALLQSVAVPPDKLRENSLNKDTQFTVGTRPNRGDIHPDRTPVLQ